MVAERLYFYSMQDVISLGGICRVPDVFKEDIGGIFYARYSSALVVSVVCWTSSRKILVAYSMQDIVSFGGICRVPDVFKDVNMLNSFDGYYAAFEFRC